MHRSSNLAKKSLTQLEPGELIRYNFGTGTSLLLLLKKNEDGTGIFGVIDSPVFEQPMSSHAMTLTGDCLSYGGDWFLEEIHGPETAIRGYYLAQSSSLALDSNGAVFIFKPERTQYGFPPIFFNASTGNVIQNFDRQNIAPVMEWRIWESQDHFSEGGNPIFEIKPEQTN